MNVIFVPTDFSEVSHCAIDYAAELAVLTSAKLVIFHSCEVPVLSPDGTVVVPMDVIQDDSLKSLKKTAEHLRKKYGKMLTVESEQAIGFPVEEINRAVVKFKADLIIIGMQGGGFITEKIVGSITTSLIKRAKCPVLAIHKGTKFKPIKKIALACDYHKLAYPTVLKPVKELATLFKSEILILNVVHELEEVPTISKAAEGVKLNRALEGIKHSFHYMINHEVTDGISDFVKENEIDLIAMVPHSHTVIETIFKESNTKHMAFHVAKPLLAIHDKE